VSIDQAQTNAVQSMGFNELMHFCVSGDGYAWEVTEQ
jgi:hypothetical protein